MNYKTNEQSTFDFILSNLSHTHIHPSEAYQWHDRIRYEMMMRWTMQWSDLYSLFLSQTFKKIEIADVQENHALPYVTFVVSRCIFFSSFHVVVLLLFFPFIWSLFTSSRFLIFSSINNQTLVIRPIISIDEQKEHQLSVYVPQF